MHRMEFHIKGMCCVDEIGQLKREVGPLVGGESSLSFDLLSNKMTILSSGSLPSSAQIMEAVARTGMEATPWKEQCARSSCEQQGNFWVLHGRFILSILSGILTLSGFLLQSYFQGGILPAPLDGKEGSLEIPRVSIALYLAAIVCGAWLVAPRAYHALLRLKPDMHLLMFVAVFGAVVIGQWLEAASVTFLFSLALYLESWSLCRARRAIISLLDISPTTARFLCPHDGDIQEKPAEEVPIGAIVLVRPGERVPLDGIITRGATSINQAPITGESMPVYKGEGDEVFAGTVNGENSFEFRSTRLASDTTVAHIIRMVEDAQSRRAPADQWVEKFARAYTPAMLFLAFAVFLIPPLTLSTPWSSSLYQALVLLVIACPCSLVISTPVTIVAGITSAARKGVLIKGGAYLEAPAKLKGIAFDKTGTLTEGQPAVQEIIPLGNHTEEELLSFAAALESHSTHPIARAIMKHAAGLGLEVLPARDFTVLPGQGAMGIIGTKTYWIGSHRLSHQLDHDDPQFNQMVARLEAAGHSLVVMWCEDHVCGAMSISDVVRKQAPGVIRELKKLGLNKIVMITGDNRQTAKSASAQLGVDEWHAELLPQDKAAVVAKLRGELGEIAMVGDGINDAPAMAVAGVSIAMGAAGSDTAIETADVALMADDLEKIPWLIRHSRKALRIIRQNILFSLGMKGAFVVLTFAGYASLWAAIAADMGASLTVIFNGLRLLRVSRGRDDASP
ncbi:MAG: heavy metal translocating P-type ATPase [Deltaproteobacteria bacterium]|nr:heavy metal translocating P-type ATPase [Deltaproteobacteria bacterium]